MTVEQNVLQQSAAQKHQQTFLNQLREITGINDTQILQQALKDSNGNLELAVAFLTAKNAKTPQQEETTYYQTALPGNDRYISVGSQADTNVIDLTGDDKDDLQRAIALSLAESNRAFRETGITDEEQAISRVLEASIAENKACLKRTPTEVWRDSRNPYDRKRQDKAPVGLKNVGNTCWFSAVIQSLFNLLEFRRLVLNYKPPSNAQDLPRNQKEHRNLPFMRELRYLFALLVGTKRKYVDPSRAVEILKDAFKSNDSQQQDVSEFTHKLLDWLEDAFQMKAEEETDEEKPKNPMVELFYGRFLAVGVLEGKKFENTEMFGQYPLQVNGFKDLHECLEAAMIEGEIESLHSENSGKSGQEHWFTELPPVLTFELSRFEFNQALGRPEKIHNKLEFPQVLYLDRYMHRNREITRIKREEIKRLKDYLTVLQQRLERYLSYGSGPKRFPLVDVLQYALEFASSKPVCTSPVDDIDASSPPSGSIPSQTLPSTTEQQGALSSELPSTSPSSVAAISSRSVIHKPFTQSRIPPDLPMHPAPRHITEEELSVLESCLHRWRTEIENDTRGCF
ncbi:ubiquitin carboxyl-terminal hydrolase 25 isoform X8 [Homo sapiens]|uniref:ubiquitin carboxyl-terminal hydrolase 25 isoform X8 n=1 Tax=Homo sapiens TaxID=9606 RepID=UPI0005D00FAA|nr:ubiquitin carboxyl-terminal hydrolase 25 isoform X8 [Homo sapiens]XP_054180423.1 ubiquitin carboxyl-terminal hydrolase 25 isoform X8 [Homo sapiens]|eukprot:XP_011527837.1 ubiquitin carboxyl-terminal hydrolase 25 isoform X6 [Homo sapiens]